MKEKKSTISKEFSKRIKQLRQQRGWSQGQVAKKIGIEAERISKYERDILHPTSELTLRLANLFEVSLDYLMRDDEDIKCYEIKNKHLLKQVKEAEKLPEEQQKIVSALLEAFIKQQKLEELMRQ